MYSLIKEYSFVKKKEIVDELVLHFDKKLVDNIFKVLAELSVGQKDYQELMEIFDEYELSHELFETLIEYNLIVPRGADGHLYFNYREQSAKHFNYKEFEYRLPKVLYMYFKER